MKNQRIKARRQPKTKGQKMLRAITQKDGKKKKLRAVAASPAAGFNDVDKSLSSKIISGLFIILMLHIFAVAAIVIHGKFNKDNIQKVKIEGVRKPTVNKGALALIDEESSKISNNESFTWVNPGETYESIAERIGCDSEELKRLNKNKPIRAGRAIKTPPKRKIEVISPEINAVGGAPKVTVEEIEPDVHRIHLEQPSEIKANIQAVQDYHTHIFKDGETFWALSKKYKVSIPAIQKANPHLKPTAIKEGTSIKIPK